MGSTYFWHTLFPPLFFCLSFPIFPTFTLFIVSREKLSLDAILILTLCLNKYFKTAEKETFESLSSLFCVKQLLLILKVHTGGVA